MNPHGFHQLHLSLGEGMFADLEQSASFEDVAKGRKGNHLVDPSAAGIPLVRTTTQYHQPACRFTEIHRQIVRSIQTAAADTQGLQAQSVQFNNALIEIYDSSYTSMKYHSDQCLDIAEDSFIALYSCYEHPEAMRPADCRKLKVRSKATEEEFEFALDQNSVILFSTDTNARFQHKIVLEAAKGATPIPERGRWLGITFRLSKTFIQFRDGKPYFSNGTELRLANAEESKEFYRLRGAENAAVGFVYPEVGFTISGADLMEPTLQLS